MAVLMETFAVASVCLPQQSSVSRIAESTPINRGGYMRAY